MPVCANKNWDMRSTVDNTTVDIRFAFLDVRVEDEVISGWVLDEAGNRTPLNGRCSPVSSTGEPDVSFMDFRFIARAQHGDVEIVMGGIGFFKDPRITFEGRFIAVAPTGELQPTSMRIVGIDEGDTGTGSGTQT